MGEKPNGIICALCQYSNLPGTLFCLQCGAYLPSGGPLRTEPFDEQQLERAALYGRESSESGARTMGIEVEVLETKRKVWLSADSEILVGRLDAAHGVFPELDLTSDGGLEQGISRRHARMYAHEGRWHIEDLDSTNGTYVNDVRLTPYVPVTFEDGDTLALGTLRLRVSVYSGRGSLP